MTGMQRKDTQAVNHRAPQGVLLGILQEVLQRALCELPRQLLRELLQVLLRGHLQRVLQSVCGKALWTVPSEVPVKVLQEALRRVPGRVPRRAAHRVPQRRSASPPPRSLPIPASLTCLRSRAIFLSPVTFHHPHRPLHCWGAWAPSWILARRSTLQKTPLRLCPSPCYLCCLRPHHRPRDCSCPLWKPLLQKLPMWSSLMQNRPL